MKKTRWIILALFAIILICVFAVILPQQNQKEATVKTQTAAPRQATKAAGLTEAVMTAASPLTSLEQACKQDGAHTAVTGKLGLSALAVIGGSKIDALRIEQDGTEASLADVLICTSSILKNCVQKLPGNYTAADLKGFDADGRKLASGDIVTVYGVVDLSSGGCVLRFNTIKKTEP